VGLPSSSRVSVLGVGFDPVTMAQARALVEQWLAEEGASAGDGPPRQEGAFRLVVTANPEGVMYCRRDPAFREVVERAALVVADGTGVVWASRVLGHPLPGRVPGIELAEGLLQACARTGWPVFLLGGKAGVAAEAARRLQERYAGLQVAGVGHGYFTADEEPLQAIDHARPVFLLCGMGCPRQELWLDRYAAPLAESGVRVGIGVGGALDVWAERVRRAPPVWGRLGLEWLWRGLQEPRRLRRQVALVRFVWEVWRRRRGAPPGRNDRG